MSKRLGWHEKCSTCDRRKSIFVERGQRWCRKCAEAEPAQMIRRAYIRWRYGSDPAAYTPAVLREIAASGIMDSNTLFAPAGKLSMEETRRREAATIISQSLS